MRKLAALFLALVAAGLSVAAYRAQVDSASPHDWAVALLAVAWSFLVAGFVAWSRRSGNNIGPLLLAAGFAVLVRGLRYSHQRPVFTFGYLLGDLMVPLIGHASLAYPTGRLHDRYERALVKAGYATVLLFPLAVLLVYDGRRPLLFFRTLSPSSAILVHGSEHAAELLQKAEVIVISWIFAPLFILLIVRRLVAATPRMRRMLAPLLLAAIALAAHSIFLTVSRFGGQNGALSYLFWWQTIAAIALPMALLAGMLRSRLARANVGDFVVELERTRPQDLRSALARTLIDPTVELLYWLPEQQLFVDTDGTPREPPLDDPHRSTTRLESETGVPIAVLVHDPSLLDEPKLLQAAGAAARLALENARLHAETQLQLRNVEASRARIVTAADEERRRIERNIHDGAQQRLVALALELRNAQRRLGDRADPEIDRVLTSAVAELRGAVDELRALARGVHPAILTEDGLAAALESLTTRSPLPVEIHVGEERLPPPVEAAAYFLACEALTNAVKHAHASKVTVTGERNNGRFVIEISDDGVGGAHVTDGSGLQGLTDRVEALGGRLTIQSAPAAGTRIMGEIPCAS